MNRQQIQMLLEQAGIHPAQAEVHTERFFKTQLADQRLSKSLEILEDAREAQEEREIDQSARLEKAFSAGEATLAEAMAEGLDQMLGEMRAQNTAMNKALTSHTLLIKGLREDLEGLGSSSSEPAPMSKAHSWIPSPSEQPAKAADSREELMKSILDQAPEESHQAIQLLDAMALIEGGGDLSAIQNQINGQVQR